MNCDPIAPWYRRLEYLGLGRALERCRLAFLPELTDVRRVLVLGEGDGRFLTAFLVANRRAEVDCVDLSAGMLSLAAQRTRTCPAPGRVHFHHADARVWRFPADVEFDLIVTHFFLDCFTTEELAPLLGRVAAATTDRARWIVSEFQQPARGLARWRARLWIAGLYGFFRLATGLRVRHLPHYRPSLEKLGFRCERAITSEMGLLVSEWWQRN